MSTDLVPVEASNGTPAASLHAKLAEIMAEVSRVPKRGRNEFHKYDYATEADIVEAVRGALSSRGISLVPSIKQVLREGTLTTAIMEFQFTDGATGETMTVGWAGTGEDKGDKGLYKAMTGALKYFLLKTFLMPTGDDPEADEGTDKRPALPSARGKSRASAPGPFCPRCGETRLAGRGDGLCATCGDLADKRRAMDAGTEAPPASNQPTPPSRPTQVAASRQAGASESDPAPRPSPEPAKPLDATTERKRAFALMERYGIANDAAHRPDRLAVYGKALGLQRLATEKEAKAFTGEQWATICEWLRAANEPPDLPPPGMAS